MTQTAGIVIDAWKLKIFERHLKGAGYDFTQQNFTADTILLKVSNVDDVTRLTIVIGRAERECKTQ